MAEQKDFNKYEPIPIPLSERLRKFQHQGLPFVIFTITIVIVAFLWDERVNAPGFIGQVVADSALVTSPNDGQIDHFYLNTFDRVEKGDAMAQIVRVDSAYFQARLDYISAQIRDVENALEPVINRQRNIIDYENLRMENIQARIDLATLKIREPQLEAQYQRAQEIYNQNGISEEELQRIESEYLIVKSEIEQKTEMVDTMEERLQEIERYVIDEDAGTPISSAVDVFEKELRVVETELKPITIHAPIGGVISKVYKGNGEYVTAGSEMFKIESTEPSYIIGYVKPPFNLDPEPSMKVQVRTRKPSRDFFSSHILRVGGHIELLDQHLIRPGMTFERGLAVQVAIPRTNDVKLYPGEIVDIMITP